ncbi:MAG: hypothetical protein M1274_10505 [Actinobacteria bacterium]|nr:hypothetical protein [Actinomycetota bacterium]
MSNFARAPSVEGPEAAILAGQMLRELVGKRVARFDLSRSAARLQEIGFLNRDPADYEQLVGGVVDTVVARGNTVVMKLDNGMNLVFSPEYGGEIFFWEEGRSLPAQYHLKLDFDDGSFLTTRITSMGGVTATRDSELAHHYLYARDFNRELLDPLDPASGGFSFERFSAALSAATRGMKSVLVGKDAILVGISNSTFQDLFYRARIHPKRRASELGTDERLALFEAVRFVMSERLRLGGKNKWLDLYRRPGGYVAAMGPGMAGQACGECGAIIQKLALGGGDVNLCPSCQRYP